MKVKDEDANDTYSIPDFYLVVCDSYGFYIYESNEVVLDCFSALGFKVFG